MLGTDFNEDFFKWVNEYVAVHKIRVLVNPPVHIRHLASEKDFQDAIVYVLSLLPKVVSEFVQEDCLGPVPFFELSPSLRFF